MHLVQLLLPIRDPSGRAFPRALYDDLAHALAEGFGGVTAHSRAPATGLWEAADGEQVRDDVVVYEVMVAHLDLAWWLALRKRLESQFRQEDLVVRAHEILRL